MDSIVPVELPLGGHSPCVSVVTVCFNALKTLPTTFASLQAQVCRDFEWVVVDGGSSDGTTGWLEARRQRMSAYLSEPDRGIFDAMNKAVKLCKGEWVLFLNADDQFADGYVLQDMIAELHRVSCDVGLVFGDARYTDGQRIWPRSFAWVNPRNLVYGDLCHQVVFARRSLFDSTGLFDTVLRFNADFDWLLRVIGQQVAMRHVPRDVVIFYKGGAHVQSALACESERYVVRHRYRRPLHWRIGNLALRIALKIRRVRGEAV